MTSGVLVLVVVAAIVVLIAVEVIRRAVVSIADADARRDRALQLLDDAHRAREVDRQFYMAKLETADLQFRDTVKLYRDALAELAGLVAPEADADGATDAETPAGKKRVM